MLPDSGHIQEFEVKRTNKRNAARGQPQIHPIHTREDGAKAAENIRHIEIGEWLDAAPGLHVRFWNAGHILGSTSIEFEIGKDNPRRILFSGDVGSDHKTLQADPEGPKALDYVVVESTYGDRDRADLSPEARRGALKAEIQVAMTSGGNILIPAFAVERTQELLFDLGLLMDAGEIPAVPVYLDSPLAIHATEVFEKHAAAMGGVDVSANPFHRSNIRFVESVDESMELARVRGAIIMAASSVCDAGRIRHHLQNNLSDSKATVLFVGYQTPGTLGSLLLDCAKKVRMHGEEIAVNARIPSVDFYSAHADRGQIIDWIQDRLPISSGIFLSHGEQSVIEALRGRLITTKMEPNLLFTPQLDEAFDLGAEGAPKHYLDRPRLDSASIEQNAFSDWHNDYAALLLELANDLRSMPDAQARRRMLADLRRTLKGRGQVS